MSRRAVAMLLSLAMFVSTNVIAGVAAQSHDLPSAQLAAPLGIDPVTRVGVNSVAAFDPAGGWAAIAPTTTTGELLYYRGLDALSNQLSGVTRFAPRVHDAGAALAPIEASDLVAAAGAPINASPNLSEAGALEGIAIDSVEAFPTSGVALATTSSGIALFYFASTDAASSALSEIGGADPTVLATSTSVSMLDPASPFPLVVDPPPVTVPGIDPSPTTVDPSPVGPYTVEPLDPSPIAIVGPDPDPVVADPPPVTKPGIDPDPLATDPPPVGIDGPDLEPVVADPPPVTKPGIDPDPVVADPPPVYLAGPDLDAVVADPPPVHKPGIDPAPVVADPPPVGIDGIDLAPVPVDPPPYAIGVIDPEAVYLDPAGYIVPGVDPPAVGYDAPPVAAKLPDPAPVGDTYVNPPNPGTVTYDPPGAGGTYVNPAVPGPVSYDPPPLGGGSLTLPDARPVCVEPSPAKDLIEDVTSGITIPTLPPIGKSTAATCLDPVDGGSVPLPVVDARPVTVTVPDPCPAYSGCFVPRVDPAPVSVTAPDPCPAYSGCYVPKVDLAAPPPVYLDPPPALVDLAPLPGATVNPAPISYDPAPLPGASGDPAEISVDPPAVPDVNRDLGPVAVDPQPIPGVSQDPAAVVVDPQPLPDVNKDLDPVGIDLQPLPGVSQDPAAVVVDPEPLPDVNQDLDPVGVDVQPLPGVSQDPGAVIVDPTPVDVLFDPPELCNGGPDPINPSCTIPAIDAPPVTVDVPGACTIGTGLCGTHDPAPVATIDPSSPPPLPGGLPIPVPPVPTGFCPSSSSDPMAGSADTSMDSAEEPILQLEVEGGHIKWADIDADCYRLVDPYEKLFITTADSSFAHPALLTGDNFSVTVAAFRNNSVIAIERLRGSTIALKDDAATPSVQDGLELLSAMIVRTTPASVHFQLPKPLIGVVEGWNLYRNESLIATAGSGVASLTDTTPASPLSSVTYSVQLLAPGWITPYEDSLGWIHASEVPCVADADVCPSSPLDPSTTDASAVDAAHEVDHVTGGSEEDSVSGDLLTFAIPIEIPAMTDPFQLNLLLPAAGSEATSASASSTAEASNPNAWGCRDYWTSHCLDDSVVYHRTFIPEKYIDAPECPPDCNPWGTNYAFGGDDRGFGDRLTNSTRTRVSVRMDWEGIYTGAHPVTYIRDVSPTKRYIILPDGSKQHESTKTGYVNPTVQFIAHHSSRYRIRVRHAAKNPFENYYPAIDYEWEYVMTRDGGVTTKGLHDGAPNYEDFYRAPFSNGIKRVYTHSHTDFKSLMFPMDQKNRRWCSNGCPNFGTARWVD